MKRSRRDGRQLPPRPSRLLSPALRAGPSQPPKVSGPAPGARWPAVPLRAPLKHLHRQRLELRARGAPGRSERAHARKHVAGASRRVGLNHGVSRRAGAVLSTDAGAGADGSAGAQRSGAVLALGRGALALEEVSLPEPCGSHASWIRPPRRQLYRVPLCRNLIRSNARGCKRRSPTTDEPQVLRRNAQAQ